MAAELLYHRARTGLVGTILYPLNQLADRFPEIHRKRQDEYRGRLDITRMRVPILDCLWGDVLFLSPIHPKKICKLRTDTGYPRVTRTYFEVDPDQCGITAENSVIFRHEVFQPEQMVLAKSDFVPFDRELIGEYSEIPAKSIAYYRDSFSQGKRPLVYLYMPQVLYMGVLSFDDLPVIEVT
jgi:hypothetical protein